MTTKKSHEWPSSFKLNLEWIDCSEESLQQNLKILLRSAEGATHLSKTVIFLEGEMGAGKSAFVRSLLLQLCPSQKSHGSPTFPIVQEYHSEVEGDSFPIYHIDVYRLKSEQELDEVGIDALLDSLPSLVCIEWASLFPGYFEYYKKPTSQTKRRSIEIKITRSQSGAENLRNFYLSG